MKYNPHELGIFRPGEKASTWFEKDVIGFVKIVGARWEQCPTVFIEFTTTFSEFKKNKFFYEVYRWQWFKEALIEAADSLLIPDSNIESSIKPIIKRCQFYQNWKSAMDAKEKNEKLLLVPVKVAEYEDFEDLENIHKKIIL